VGRRPGSLLVGQVDDSEDARERMRAFRLRIEQEHVRDTWTNPHELAFKVWAAPPPPGIRHPDHVDQVLSASWRFTSVILSTR
jgi:hypothetical protein